MPSTQDILNDVDLRYRNTYTTTQKLVWFNEEQRELFDILEIDSPPYAFTTVEGENFYPFPDDFDITKIKVVTYQIDDSENFVEIPMVRNDDNQYAPNNSVWYTATSDTLYLYVPGGVLDNRAVYIYCDSDPTKVTNVNLSSPPDLPTKYQEILKLGVLKRIALARKDTVFLDYYSAMYNEKIADVVWGRKLREPEWTTAIDTLPRAGRRR